MNLKKLGKLVSVLAALALFCLTFAGCSTAGTSSDGSTLGSFSYIIMIVLMFAVFYFFLIRPENKKKKKLNEMRNNLEVGDTVTTIGGLMGKIVSIKDDTVTFETGEDRVRIQVTKWAISTTGKSQEQQN